MNIKVQFFEDRLVDSVGAGVYEIYAKTDNKEIPVVIELREAAKNHKVISFFADKLDKKEGGSDNGR